MLTNVPAYKIVLRMSLLVVLMFSVAACAFTAPQPDNNPAPNVNMPVGGAPVVSLAAPVNGATYLEGVPVNILARVENAGEDIDRVEILVDNQIVNTIPLPNPAGAPLFGISQNWVAEGTGARTIGVTVFRTDGSSSALVERSLEVVANADNIIVVEAPAQAIQPTQEQVVAAPVEVQPTEEQAAPPPVEAQPTEEQAALPPAEVQPTEEQAAPPPAEPTAIPPTATSSRPTGTLTVGANVRSGPSTEFVRVGSFPANEQVTLLAVNSARTWYKVQYYYGDGWVAADLLNVTNAANLPIDDGPPPPTPVPPTATPVPATAAPQSNKNITFEGAQGFAPFPPECGQTMTITLRLKNTGSEALGTSSAAIVRDVHIDSGAVTSTTIPIPDIGAGQTIEVSGGFFLTVDTNFDSRHRIEIVLDANSEITETDENDNFFSGNEYTLAKGGC